LWAIIDRVVGAHPPADRRAPGQLNPRLLLAPCGGDPAILDKICQTFRARLPDNRVSASTRRSPPRKHSEVSSTGLAWLETCSGGVCHEHTPAAAQRRRAMVQAVRQGASMRQVADLFGVALATVQRWVQRAQGQRLDRVDWTDRPCGLPTSVNRTERQREDLVLTLRQQLRATSDLGEFGAAAIHREWRARGLPDPPALRTIGLILERRGALDRRRRVRRPAPPSGWYLPAVADGRAELDSIDAVEGLVIRGGTQGGVLTAISLHGCLVAAWPQTVITAAFVVQALIEHWRACGLPG